MTDLGEAVKAVFHCEHRGCTKDYRPYTKNALRHNHTKDQLTLVHEWEDARIYGGYMRFITLKGLEDYRYRESTRQSAA